MFQLPLKCSRIFFDVSRTEWMFIIRILTCQHVHLKLSKCGFNLISHKLSNESQIFYSLIFNTFHSLFLVRFLFWKDLYPQVPSTGRRTAIPDRLCFIFALDSVDQSTHRGGRGVRGRVHSFRSWKKHTKRHGTNAVLQFY